MSATRDAWTHWHNTRAGRAPASTRSKYGAKVVHVNGLRFDSQREAARYAELTLLLSAGEISDLEIHPGFPLMVLELTEATAPPWVMHTIGMYHADFKYRNVRTGNIIVEDVKSKPTKTEAYALRKKHVEAQYGITIVEIT
jgi:hypothetical protein